MNSVKLTLRFERWTAIYFKLIAESAQKVAHALLNGPMLICKSQALNLTNSWKTEAPAFPQCARMMTNSTLCFVKKLRWGMLGNHVVDFVNSAV